ncbi:hypothetical protein GFK26_15915 [Variovorax paradoxus]|uniref:Uncharacterized protein n=1 Tax=Variovorax paradoxus TaxID=34073 RepID=A0A5Q0M6C5_VARPD|nr:hypothetical protein GFK26_15915 [Variovorax paradoxus]
MSWSDSGSPTAARMLISLQRFDGTGRRSAGSRCASGAGAAVAVICGRGFGAGRTTAGLGSASLACGASAGLGTARHGVRHGLASPAAWARAPCSAITVATTAVTARARGETRAG